MLSKHSLQVWKIVSKWTFHAASAELFRSGVSNASLTFSCPCNRQWLEVAVWSSQSDSMSEGVLPRGRTGWLHPESQGISYAWARRRRESLSSLGLGSLLEQLQWAHNGNWWVDWGEKIDSTPSSAICSLFEWTKGSLPRLRAYLPAWVTRCN
jgi:hypothetical protein